MRFKLSKRAAKRQRKRKIARERTARKRARQ